MMPCAVEFRRARKMPGLARSGTIPRSVVVS